MVRCERCRLRLADMTDDHPYYTYNAGDRLPDRNGHAEHKLRDGSIYLCNATRWQAAE